jgi:hypothetical protein
MIHGLRSHTSFILNPSTEHDHYLRETDGQRSCQKRNLPDMGVVDVKGQTNNSKDNAQAGEN